VKGKKGGEKALDSNHANRGKRKDGKVRTWFFYPSTPGRVLKQIALLYAFNGTSFSFPFFGRESGEKAVVTLRGGKKEVLHVALSLNLLTIEKR